MRLFTLQKLKHTYVYTYKELHNPSLFFSLMKSIIINID